MPLIRNLNKTDHYVYSNIEARSCNHCCSAKAKRITYSECVFVALGIQREMRMRHIINCGLSGSTIILSLPHKRHAFRKRIMERKIVF